MSEWRLFTDRLPEPTESLAARGWMNLAGQPGFGQRADMVTALVFYATRAYPHISSITEVGCGDGSMLFRVGQYVPRMKRNGYELGLQDVRYAREVYGLDVEQADIVAQLGELEIGDLVIISEVLEHLESPAELLRAIPDDKLLIATSPSLETGAWHNDIHAWAWDLAGYEGLLTRGGWDTRAHFDVDGGINTFAGQDRRQRFQGILATRR